MHGKIRKENEIDRNSRYILEFEREDWKKESYGTMREMKPVKEK